MAGESGELAASPPATRSALAPVAVKLAGGRVKSLATPSPVSRSPARNEGLLLLELRAFDRRQLRSTETVVTTPTGERVVERSPAPEDLDADPEEAAAKRMAALKLAARRSLDAAGGDRAPVRVAPRLFLGGAAAARNGRGLTHRGVTHVLNASPAVPCHFRAAAPPGAAAPLRYLLLEDLFDDAEADLLRHVDAACAFIDVGRAAGGVLVHCFAGQSRSAALVMAYLIVRQGESLAGAWAAVRSARPAAAPNAGFLRQLAALEARLKGGAGGAGGGGSPRSMASSLAESLGLLELLPQ